MPRIMPPSIPRLPDPGGIDVTDPVALKEYLVLLTSSVSKHLMQRAPMNAAINNRLMLTESGKTYKLVVTDAGVVEAQPFGSAEDQIVPPL